MSLGWLESSLASAVESDWGTAAEDMDVLLDEVTVDSAIPRNDSRKSTLACNWCIVPAAEQSLSLDR